MQWHPNVLFVTRRYPLRAFHGPCIADRHWQVLAPSKQIVSQSCCPEFESFLNCFFQALHSIPTISDPKEGSSLQCECPSVTQPLHCLFRRSVDTEDSGMLMTGWLGCIQLDEFLGILTKNVNAGSEYRHLVITEARMKMTCPAVSSQNGSRRQACSQWLL